MSDLQFLPISYLDENQLLPLMYEEEKAWISDLSWDYTPVRRVLTSFVRQKLLPGYAAVAQNEAIAYTYFLVNQSKGIIGAIYASKARYSQEAVDELIALTVSSLKDTSNIKRVEAQIMPFNNLNLTATFIQHGFNYFPRYFLEMDLRKYRELSGYAPFEKIIPWSSAYLVPAAEMSLLSYRNQIDAEICEDYGTRDGSESYLRSLIENSGCGVFMPEASFMALDKQGAACGFLICSRLSSGAAMVPQIAVHPSYQGLGVGNTLMDYSIGQLKNQGFKTISLTVTKKNRRAFEWYQRLGFRIRKDFGAYVWQRI